MSHIELQPFRQVNVSYSDRHSGTAWFIVGEVENVSDQPVSCVSANFSMSGRDHQDLGILSVEIRNLAPHEKRPYERQLPQQAGFHLQSKSECR
jgi:hypothetical protein